MTRSMRDVWQDQLDDARDVLARHYRDGGLCACLRTLPCPAAAQWATFAQDCRERIGHYDAIIRAATQEIPTLASRRV